MTAVNCPMCELRFRTRTERDWHLHNEHHHPHRSVDPPGGHAARPKPDPPDPHDPGDER